MKIICLATILFLCGGLPSRPAQSQEPPPSLMPKLEGAEVRIPYTALKQLWDAAAATSTKAPSAPLPAGALLAVAYDADLSGSQVALEAEFRVESFTGQFEQIRLTGADWAVAAVEPAEARITVAGDDLVLMAKDPGQQVVKVRFANQPLPSTADQPFLRLHTVPSAVTALTVKGIPEGRILKSGPYLVTPTNGSAYLPLSAKGGEVTLTLGDASETPKPLPPPEPSEWTLQNEVLVYEDESTLRHEVHTLAAASNGSALEMTFFLPANTRSLKVEGDGLTSATTGRSVDGRTEVKVRWTQRDIMERELRLHYALPKLPLALEWEMRAPELSQEDRVKSLYVFPAQAGVEFKGDQLIGPVASSKLPRWVREARNDSEFFTISAGSATKVSSQLLPRLETASSVITKSSFTTKVVGDGAMMTDASLEIEHDASLRWSLTLPAKASLLKCSVDGTAVQPISRPDSVLEIPLTASSSSKGTLSKVSFSYTETKEKLQAVEGEASLELPLTPTFINEVLWRVELPTTYEVTATEGNLEQTPSDSASAAQFTKKLCRNERPQARLYYSKSGIR